MTQPYLSHLLLNFSVKKKVTPTEKWQTLINLEKEKLPTEAEKDIDMLIKKEKLKNLRLQNELLEMQIEKERIGRRNNSLRKKKDSEVDY